MGTVVFEAGMLDDFFAASVVRERRLEGIKGGMVVVVLVAKGDFVEGGGIGRANNCVQVEIRYLFRYPVSRSVHARFLHPVPKALKRVDVGYLSFHTSPNPTPTDKALFEVRRSKFYHYTILGVPKKPS